MWLGINEEVGIHNTNQWWHGPLTITYLLTPVFCHIFNKYMFASWATDATTLILQQNIFMMNCHLSWKMTTHHLNKFSPVSSSLLKLVFTQQENDKNVNGFRKLSLAWFH